MMTSRATQELSLRNFINFRAYQKCNLFLDVPKHVSLHIISKQQLFLNPAGWQCSFLCYRRNSGDSLTYATQSTIIPAQHFLSRARFSVLVKSRIIESQLFIYIASIFFYELFIIPLFMFADVTPRCHAWPHVQIGLSRVPLSY